MRMALLNTNPVIDDMFSQNYPDVVLCKEANEKFLAAECLIILADYQLEEGNYQILRLWEKYLRKRNARKKLVIMGREPFRSRNYLQITQLPTLNDNFVKNAYRAGGKGDFAPTYPKPTEEDILPALGRIIHSHGKNALQKLLIEARSSLRAVEKALAEQKDWKSILAMSKMQDAGRLMGKAKNIWESRKPFFQLAPQYSDLSKVKTCWQAWETLMSSQRSPEPKVSKQIGDYIQEVIIDMVRFYQMEKE